MKAGLQVRLGQQVTMTPQLQQAIRLLQLSNLELHHEIQQALESNIMLEEVTEDEYETEDSQDLDLGSPEEDVNADSLREEQFSNSNIDLSSTNDDGSEETTPADPTDIPNELDVDSSWEDIYDGTVAPTDLSNSAPEDNDFTVNQVMAAETLQDHLRWQLDMTHFSDLDRACAIAIIDAIDSDGYLRASLEDIEESLGNRSQVSSKEIEIVLCRIQHFDPLGVGARDLSECLLLQLSNLADDTPWLKEAKILVSEHLELLGTYDYSQLTKLMTLSREQLGEVIKLIKSLNSRPGAQIESPRTAAYVIPDVFVKKVNGQWKVELNHEALPKVRINNYYAGLISRHDNSADNQNLKTHLQEARWYIKSLKSREDTLLSVAKCIVKRQSAFLNYGEEAMKPLILHDIASELEMHESTISRVTTQKYIHTPRGFFELKYFFSSHVGTEMGGECSSTAIRAIIKKMITEENSAKPLSDNKIANLLSDRGIQVARRTIAKYREAMAIPPSGERKRLAQ